MPLLLPLRGVLVVAAAAIACTGAPEGCKLRVGAEVGAPPAPRRAGRASPAAADYECTATIDPAGREARRTLRAATWNLRWFPDGAPSGASGAAPDLDALACELANLDVDVLAAQEVLDHPDARTKRDVLLARLSTLTGGEWTALVDDCPGERMQHVAFFVDRRRVDVLAASVLPSLNPLASACASSLRPGLSLTVRRRGTSLPPVEFITLHLDSGTTDRDRRNRATSLDRLATLAAHPSAPHRRVVLGDFNTMGCVRCTPRVSAADEIAATDARLSRAALPLTPARDGVPCTYPGPPSRRGTLDHVFVSEALAPDAATEVRGPCASSCATPRREFTARISDHCPVVVELDRSTGAPIRGVFPPR